MEPAPLTDRVVAAPTKRPELPFHTIFSGNANPQPTPNPCILANRETGSGTAMHLGRFTWLSDETVDLCPVPGHGMVTGHFVLAAANRDQIYGQYQTDAQFDLNGVSVIGRYQLTGGTGRFKDASGSGTLEAMGALAPPFPFEASLSGTISY